MRIYFDSCALTRLTDNSSQLRVRIEAEAVERLLERVWKGRLTWIASVANELEVRRNPDDQMRIEGLALLSFAEEVVRPGSTTRARARSLAQAGYGAFDALHLACAEQANVHVLLTTDDRFIGRAARKVGNPTVRVANPVDWLKEIGP
jgi:predicted nucleic acid-binding protein